MKEKINPFKEIENTSIKYPECLEYLKGCNESEVLEAVDSALDYISKTHQYSMSRIYSLWNFLFDRNETPQSCASCLIRKTQDIKNWLSERQKGNLVLGVAGDLVGKTEQKPKKTTRAKRKEA